MTDRTYEQAQDLYRHLYWLKGIADSYQGFITRAENNLREIVIDGVIFHLRGPEETFSINCHRSIDVNFIVEGLRLALAKIKAEIEDTRNKIEAL